MNTENRNDRAEVGGEVSSEAGRTIADIDRRIRELVGQRIRAVLAAEGSRQSPAASWFVEKAREEEQLAALTAENTGELDPDRLRRIFTEILAACREARAPQNIAYLGPEATFTHVAARNYFGTDDAFAPQLTIRDVFDEVEKGACRYGVVPVENSIEGAVNHTLDLFLESELHICGETYLAISHDLLSQTGEVANIAVIYSHPQSFAQCRRWLAKHLPTVELVECSSNAQAAQKALSSKTAAAIAGSEAARLYDLKVVAPRIQDVVRNTTRFLIIGQDRIPRTGSDKTSIMFVTTHVPGALFRVLEPIARSGLNMLKLESRPAQYENWNYVFFVDLEGHAEDEAVKAALADMQEVCQFLKILGSYPRAR